MGLGRRPTLRVFAAASVGIIVAGCGSAYFFVGSGSNEPPSSVLAYQQGVDQRYAAMKFNLTRAISAEETTIIQDPLWAPAHMRLAELFWMAGQGHAALQEAEDAARLSPHNDQYRLWWGQMAQALGQSDVALKAYRTVIKANPGCWQAWDGLAFLAIARGQWASAANDAQEALLAGGPQGPTLDAMGRIAEGTGHWQTAARDFRAAESFAPQWWQSYYDLAQVDFHWGEIAMGEQSLRSALHRDPENAQVFHDLESYPIVGPLPITP